MKIKEVIVSPMGNYTPKAYSKDVTDAFYEPDLDLFIVKFGSNKQMMLPRENVSSFVIETEEDNDIPEFKIVERD